ncbi:IucA/IucC family siderophore biosynthesis protein [Idiomarina sp. HP20-50]|uniref:IucA/IucC family protein n=1 Tax=Idiomarina sp. HP20-50 TaxID=3070813 RepID=UPI00294B249A|nr:IucA/IucC family siderophore biosynthesis protein [Idiomarina sp. HP20-50]MDV6315717.1 IucA/IucC family siderophore biosynthesis protein [Idiomarina sp. HP20-50]
MTVPIIDQTHISHLTPTIWNLASRHLLAKIISEFNHERLLVPELLPQKDREQQASWQFHLDTPDGQLCYRFTGRRYQLDHLQIEPESIECFKDGEQQQPDAMLLIIALKDRLGISDALLPTYLEEITSTLYSKSFKLLWQAKPVEELVDCDYQQIEAAMTEGHPVFVANNGRIGFDAVDCHAFSPESGQPLQLEWLAVSKEHTSLALIEGLDYSQLLLDELGDDLLLQYEQKIQQQGKNPDDYFLIPVHPWQWREKVSRIFAADLARDRLIYLGRGRDKYQVQQSIRTFFNLSQPKRCYVKTALSILNMGFMRGLSPYYMNRTPKINAFVAELINSDPFFANQRFVLLREIAAIGYHHRYYEQALEKDTPYKKMLSALWRESPYDLRFRGEPLVKPGQQLMSLAALLHQDSQQQSLLAALIQASPLSAHDWVSRLLDLYLQPLLHAFFAYDLVFMPHGENLILVLDEKVPVTILMKDIGEEVAILNGSASLPKHVAELAVSLEEDMKLNYILLDIFDCIFRFIAPLLDRHTSLSEHGFWALVADKVREYQASHPQFADKYHRYDLFQATFVRTCLNRIQLNNNQQMIDLEDREQNLRFAGDIENPLHRFTASHSFGVKPTKAENLAKSAL